MKRLKRTALVLAGAGLPVMALVIHWTRAVSDNPEPVAWDQEACAECHMLISDRRFAAQLQTARGQTLNFDDPACLMTYVAHQHPSVRAIYFRDSQSARWLKADHAGFVRSTDSPMGGGLRAVSLSTAEALGYDETLREIEQGASMEGK